MEGPTGNATESREVSLGTLTISERTGAAPPPPGRHEKIVVDSDAGSFILAGLRSS
jgi:hypothetical protein